MEYLIRRVVSSDLDDILEISKRTWSGHDYLPSVIDVWMKDRDCHIIGIDVDGRIVALSNLHIIDSGQTGWMEGLRVHPRYRKKGLAKALTNELVKEAGNARVRRLRYTTDSSNGPSISLAKSIGMTKRMEMGVFWKSGLKRIRKGGVSEAPEPTRWDALGAILEKMTDFFPERIMLHDWKAYDLDSQGIAQIGKSSKLYMTGNEEAIESIVFGTVRNEDVAGWSFSVCASSSDAFVRAVLSQAFVAREIDARFIMGTFECQFEDTLNNEKWMPRSERGFRVYLFERVLN